MIILLVSSSLLTMATSPNNNSIKLQNVTDVYMVWWGVRFVQENLVTKAIGSSFRFFKFVKIPIQCFQINEAQTDVVTVPQTFCFVTFFLNITGCFIDSILINNVFFKYLLVQHYTL